MSKRGITKRKVTHLVLSKSGFSNKENDSSPAFGTKNTAYLPSKEAFLSEFLKVCQQTVPAQYPYRKAKLIHHNLDLSKRWYVDFYAWDVAKDKLVRKRLFEPLNRLKTVRQRLETGEQMVRIVNNQLASGKVFGKSEVNKVVTFHPEKLNLLDAVLWVREQKKLNGHRKTYWRTFTHLHTVLSEWIDYKKIPDFPLNKFDRADGQEFFSFLRDQKALANKSINNILNNLGIAFKYIERKSDRGTVWRKNPLEEIDQLPVVVKKHAAYSDAEIKAIKKGIKEAINKAPSKLRKDGYRQLELFIAFIYYTLARPTEITRLKISDIDLKANRIFFRGEVSKNKMDEYVEISPDLARIITRFKLKSYPPTDYIFSGSGFPGTVPVHGNFFWDKHKRVLTRIGMKNDSFTLYGYKHSGAINLYQQSKDIKLVQRQCRHRSLEQTNTYLRDLGVLSDYNRLTSWKGAV